MLNVKELKDKIKNVPFGNSQFQIQNFIANQESPERTYRNVLLQLNQKIDAMQACVFRRKRKEIELEEKKEALGISLARSIEFEARKLQIDIDEIEYGLQNEIKLIEDCAVEIATYQSILATLPEFTREQFETSEKEYWKRRLVFDAQDELNSSGMVGIGTLKSLRQLNMGIKKDEKTGQMMIVEFIKKEIEKKPAD